MAPRTLKTHMRPDQLRSPFREMLSDMLIGPPTPFCMSPDVALFLRAIVKNLHVERNRFGKLDGPHFDISELIREYGLPLPNGGLDRVDQACMVLQALVGDKPTSIRSES